MNCSDCGAVNAAGARFCSQCGVPLARRCAECGAENAAAARFCNHCGRSLTATAPATTRGTAPVRVPLPAAVPASSSGGN